MKEEIESSKLSIFEAIMVVIGLGLIAVIFIGLIYEYDQPDYKAIYEENIYNETLDSAYTNGTRDAAIYLSRVIVEEALTCNPIQIPYEGQVYNLYLEECLR